MSLSSPVRIGNIGWSRVVMGDRISVHIVSLFDHNSVHDNKLKTGKTSRYAKEENLKLLHSACSISLSRYV
jgi:hypothetical protein